MIELSSSQAAVRIAALLTAKESRTLEFKRISNKQGRMYEAICAFANTEGGLLAIGIGDAKVMKQGDKPQNRLFGIEENVAGFADFQRELRTRFTPAITKLHWIRVPCMLNNGQPGHVVLLRVDKSDQVHSIVGNGTWTRMDASNRELTAGEVADLAYLAHVCGGARPENGDPGPAVATHWPGRHAGGRAETDAGRGAAVCR